jgi:signal transduction histidine kinase
MGFNGLISSGRHHATVERGPSTSRHIQQQEGLVTEEQRPAAEELSLGQAFARVPIELGLAQAVRFRVILTGREMELRPSLKHEVYGIGREAIVNACRHSRAKEIEVEMEYRPAKLRIAVRDDGCGIDDRKLRCGKNRRSGLLKMCERAEKIGGRLRVFSRIALGTEVELCVGGAAFDREGGGIR